jgi:hypothetical protein
VTETKSSSEMLLLATNNLKEYDRDCVQELDGPVLGQCTGTYRDHLNTDAERISNSR